MDKVERWRQLIVERLTKLEEGHKRAYDKLQDVLESIVDLKKHVNDELAEMNKACEEHRKWRTHVEVKLAKSDLAWKIVIFFGGGVGGVVITMITTWVLKSFGVG